MTTTVSPELSWPKAREAYCDEVGALCPFCRSGNIEGASKFNGDMVTGDARQIVRCLQCGREWEACYGLTGYAEVSKETKKKTKKMGTERGMASHHFIMYLDAIRHQLGKLSVMTKAHFGYSVDEVHWGHTGTAQHVYEQLTEVMSSLDGFVKK